MHEDNTPDRGDSMERPPWEKQSILNEAIARGGHLGLARHALGSIGRVLSAPVNAFRTRMPSDAAIMDKVVCGVKLTYDGGIAVIEGDRLAFSFELEKLDNNRRYEQLDRLEQIDELLSLGGMKADDVDHFVLDGWHADPVTGSAQLKVAADDAVIALEVAPYVEQGLTSRPNTCYESYGHETRPELSSYSSFHHATGHLFVAYCTSPFAARGEPSLVLVWDGGMLPHLYHVGPKPADVMALGPIFPITGNAFSDFSAHFGPFRDRRPVSKEDFLRRNLEVAGKAMAYAALGRDEAASDVVFDELYDELADFSRGLGRR